MNFVGFEKEKLEKYRGSESSFYFNLRNASFEKISQTKDPDFRHGLNIDVSPNKKEVVHKNIFSPEYVVSEKDVFSSVKELQHGWESFFSKEWNKTQQSNKWSEIHTAFANNFVLIDIPENSVYSEPIDITEKVIDGPLFNTILIRVGKNAQVKFVYTKENKEGEFFVSEDVRIMAGEGSLVDFITLQNYSSDTIHVVSKQSIGERDSCVTIIDLIAGSSYTKYDCVHQLSSVGAQGDTKVLFSGGAQQLIDINTESLHNACETHSNSITKGVLFGRARALSRGLVKINSNAAGSNGYETQDVLLLSKDAEAYAVPNLEIDNSEVKCSHGSSVGQIDSEMLFYLMSRGYSRSEAVRKIVEGYFTPVLDLLSPLIREKVSEKLFNSINMGGPLTKEVAIEALKKVQDPEIPLDLWTLGLIYGIDIREDNSVDITMTFTSPMCPFGAKMMNDVRAKLIEAGFSDARVEVVLTPKWEPSEEVKMLLGLA